MQTLSKRNFKVYGGNNKSGGAETRRLTLGSVDIIPKKLFDHKAKFIPVNVLN